MIDVAVVIGQRVGTAIESGTGGKAPLFAVGCADTVGGVGAHVVDGIGRQPCNVACKDAMAVTVIGMAVIECRVLGCAPADAPVGHVRPARGGYVAGDGGLRGLDVCHAEGEYSGQFRLRVKIEHTPRGGACRSFGVCLIVIACGHLQIGDGVVKRTVARADGIIHSPCH